MKYLILLISIFSSITLGNRFENKLNKLTHESGLTYYDGHFSTSEKKGDKDSINVHVIVLPATENLSPKKALTFLAGGGVIPATKFLNFFGNYLPEYRKKYDIFLIDQRGTYGSNPILKSAELNENDTLFYEKQIKDWLTKYDLKSYGTYQAINDLNSIRKWLGYKNIDLWGVSYGTKVARMYAKFFPKYVNSITLHGVVPIAYSMWKYDSFLAQIFLDNLFVEAAIDSNYSNIHYIYETVKSKLYLKPIQLSFEGKEVKLDNGLLMSKLYKMLYTYQESREIPFLLKNIWENNLEKYKKYFKPSESNDVPLGVFYSIACNEELNRINPSYSKNRPSGDFGKKWLNKQFPIYQLWPKSKQVDNFYEPLKSDIPTLLLSGALDHVTPPVFARDVAKFLSNSKHIILPFHGHDDIDLIMVNFVQKFLLNTNIDELDISFLKKYNAIEFK